MMRFEPTCVDPQSNQLADIKQKRIKDVIPERTLNCAKKSLYFFWRTDFFLFKILTLVEVIVIVIWLGFDIDFQSRNS